MAFCSALFGGLSNPFSLGIFFITNGLCISILPIKARLKLVPILLIALALFLGVLSSGATNLPTILGDKNQLGIGLESVLMFAAAALWFFWLLARPVGEKTRAFLFQSYGSLVAVVGVLALICKIQRWPFPFTQPGSYGIFPNTNHMSNWLAMAGILLAGTGCAHIRRKNFLRAGFSLLSIAAILTCLAANSSRGGLTVFFVGLLVWAVSLTVAGPDRRIGLGLVAAATLLATTLLFHGAKPLERLRDAPPTASLKTENLPPNDPRESMDFRLKIQLDALDMIADHPWLGVGPGNFRYLFPPYRTRTASLQSCAIHPESDWLWFLSEYGIPAGLLFLGSALLLLRQAGPGGNREGWITRSAGLAALVAFAGHGLVDVAGHRFGTVWPILMVAAVTFGRKREGEQNPAGKFSIILFRVAGAALALAGCLWTWGISTDLSWPATVHAAQAKADVGAAWKAGQTEPALQAATSGLAVAPADGVLRFLHGKALLFFEDTEAETEKEFKIQSSLEPFLVSVPLDQATAWVEVTPEHPEWAVPAYTEALRRAEAYQTNDRGPERVLEHMIRMASISPGLQPKILPLIQNQPRLLSFYLSNLKPEIFRPTLASILAGNPDLKGWNENSLAPLLLHWARKGEPGSLESALESHPQWWPSGWPLLAQLRAKSGKTREALDLAQKFLPQPSLPDEPCPPNQAESRWYRSPRDYAAAYVLSETRRKNGDLTGARVVLEKITDRPETPAYFWWLRSRVESEEKRDAAAWDSLRKYMEKSVPGWPNL